MTKRPEKSRVGKKQSRGTARAKRRAKTKAAVQRTRTVAASRDPLEDFVLAAARALGLPIEPQWLPAIRMNLEVTLRQGVLVDSFALPDEAEPAPVFEA